MEINNKIIDVKDKARYQDFCFTSHADEEPGWNDKDSNYIVYQREKCPKSGKLHWQGYVEFKSKCSINKLHKMIGNKCHVEVRGGTNKQASDYCKKEDTRVGEFIEYGVLKMQGRRSDLDSIWECIEDGMTSKEILHEHKGKALRVINMVIKGLESEHGCIAIDKIILADRQHKQDTLEKNLECPEVSGNTIHSQLGKNLDNEIEKKYHVRDELRKLKKNKKM